MGFLEILMTNMWLIFKYYLLAYLLCLDRCECYIMAVDSIELKTILLMRVTITHSTILYAAIIRSIYPQQVENSMF